MARLKATVRQRCQVESHGERLLPPEMARLLGEWAEVRGSGLRRRSHSHLARGETRVSGVDVLHPPHPGGGAGCTSPSIWSLPAMKSHPLEA
jgi:hypothetical protein